MPSVLKLYPSTKITIKNNRQPASHHVRASAPIFNKKARGFPRGLFLSINLT